MPWMVVDQLVLPTTTWATPRMVGAAATISGISALRARASATVSRISLPLAMRTPPRLRAPDITMNRLLPRELIWRSISACAPAPTVTMAITAATPMMMPSIVSTLRIRLTRRASRATRRSSARGIVRPSCAPAGARRR